MKWLGWCVFAFLWGSVRAAVIVHTVGGGAVQIPVPPTSAGWETRDRIEDGDLLFADGVRLLTLAETGGEGTILTVSLDQNRPMSAEERAAFIALARDRAEAGRMELWTIDDRLWIVQEFRSPSERVVAAQMFVGPYTLAYLFWFDPGESEASQDALARELLTRWAPRWIPREGSD